MAENYLSTSNEVPFSDDETVSDDQLITEQDKPGDSQEVKDRRRQRRKERIEERERERKEQAEELATLKAKDAQRDRELSELRGIVVNNNRLVAPQKDPYEAELAALYEEQQNAWQAAQAEVKAGTYTEQRDAHYAQLGRSLESRKMQVHTRKAVAEANRANAANAGKAVWEQKYPEVYGNQQAYQYAEATFNRRKLLGETATPELVDEVMEETRNAFKLGPKKTPTKTDRERLSGIPSGGGGGGGNGSAGPTGGIDMSDRRWRKMALAAYSELPEKQAIQKWVDNEGKALRAKKII